MNKQEKNQVIDRLADKLSGNPHFYLADTSALTVEVTNNLRRKCFEKGVSLEVVKNKLLLKAMEKSGDGYAQLYEILAGPTSILFSEVANEPAKIIKEFRKTYDKPILKGAFVEESIYIGDDQVDALAALKSKNELIAEVIALLQSPAKNVVSALQSGKNTLAGLLKTLEENPVTPKASAAPAAEQPAQETPPAAEDNDAAGEETKSE
ncbi:MAG: 50S ribosomal protein L10 [Flavobacteriales bacterium]|nr:50S ribosomal protein L10 [Flavobacteriales bacterium]MCB9447459.1 50S ribosomal protein L10 [Flavobacteriales bacterium]